MEFSEIQTLIEANAERYAKKHGINFNREFLVCKLMEEVGEFTQALLIFDNQCRLEKRLKPALAKEHVEQELADILNSVFLIAATLDIDLYTALDKKILEKGRVYLQEQNKNV